MKRYQLDEDRAYQYLARCPSTATSSCVRSPRSSAPRQRTTARGRLTHRPRQGDYGPDSHFAVSCNAQTCTRLGIVRPDSTRILDAGALDRQAPKRPPRSKAPPASRVCCLHPPEDAARGADGRTPQLATTPRRYRRRGVALHGGDEAPTAAKAPRVVGGHPVTPAYGRSRPAILPPDAGGTRTHLTMTKVPNPPKQTKRLHKRPAQAVDRAPTTAPAPRQAGVHLLVSRNVPYPRHTGARLVPSRHRITRPVR